MRWHGEDRKDISAASSPARWSNEDHKDHKEEAAPAPPSFSVWGTEGKDASSARRATWSWPTSKRASSWKTLAKASQKRAPRPWVPVHVNEQAGAVEEGGGPNCGSSKTKSRNDQRKRQQVRKVLRIAGVEERKADEFAVQALHMLDVDVDALILRAAEQSAPRRNAEAAQPAAEASEDSSPDVSTSWHQPQGYPPISTQTPPPRRTAAIATTRSPVVAMLPKT